jgi:hypothetical protein
MAFTFNGTCFKKAMSNPHPPPWMLALLKRDFQKRERL